MPSVTPDVAILVHSCDRYELLYRGFAFFFSRYWDKTADCHYYFATEEKTVNLPGFENIRSGKGEWADRLAVLLKKIPESYIVYFQEDMWLNKPTDAAFFNRLFALAKEQGWKQVKLHSSEVYKTHPTGIEIEGFTVAEVDNQRSDFLMSHQVTLWDKQFLLAQLHKNEHPWRNERKGTARLKKLNPKILQIDYFAENGKPEINTNPNAARRSEYQTISMNSTLSGNVLPFIEALQQGHEDDRIYARQLQHNFTHQLTHDGRERPRKVDIFKKVKTWVKKRLG